MPTASSPVPATSTVRPCSLSPRRISAAIFTSSSTTRTFIPTTIPEKMNAR